MVATPWPCNKHELDRLRCRSATGSRLEIAEVSARRFQIFRFVLGPCEAGIVMPLQPNLAFLDLSACHPGLSMQVGGTGLTVTGANRVILVDPAWNPSADAQAIDRVHRIGQKQEAGWPMIDPSMCDNSGDSRSDTKGACNLQCGQVVVYRLIGSGAIEDKMFRLQIFKGGLSKTFMEHEQQVRFFTHKQLGSSDRWVEGHGCFWKLDCLLHLLSVWSCKLWVREEAVTCKSSPAWGWSHCLSSPTSTPGLCLEIQSRKPLLLIGCWH